MEPRILTILILSAFLMHSVRCVDIRLIPGLRDRVHDLAMQFVRLSLATRVLCDDPTCYAEVSNDQLLDTPEGRAELSALNKLVEDIEESIFPDYLKSDSCNPNYQSLRDSCVRHFMEVYKLFCSFFIYYLSSDFVQLWPRYCYDPVNDTIQIFPEVISFERQRQLNTSSGTSNTVERDVEPRIEVSYDLAPLEFRHKPKFLFEQCTKWIPQTPKNLKKPDLYQLDHIIPMSLIQRFFNLFIPVSSEIANSKNSDLLRAVNRANQRQIIGHRLNFVNVTDIDALKRTFTNELYFEIDRSRLVAWTPGNLFYGFKKRAKFDRVYDRFEIGSRVIMGRERSLKAERIYNSMLEFTNRVGYTKQVNKMRPLRKRAELNRIRQSIINDGSLLNEILGIFYEYLCYANEKNEPYSNDWRQWDKNELTGEWSIKSEYEYYDKVLKERFHKERKDEDDDSSDSGHGSLASMLHGACSISSSQAASRKKRDANDDNEKFLNFFLLNIVTNESDAVSVLLDYQKKFPNRNSTSLSKLYNFFKDNLLNHKCTENDWTCSKKNELCRYQDYNISLTLDVGDNHTSVTIPLDQKKLISSISFDHWCDGRGVRSQNKITTDSAIVRLLTFNTPKQNSLNKEILFEFLEEFKTFGYNNKTLTIYDFIDDRLQNSTSKESKILRKVCKKHKKFLASYHKNLTLMKSPFQDDLDLKSTLQWFHESPFDMYPVSPYEENSLMKHYGAVW